jgi:DNA invertase Pin-like site-specific DNA recombinase
VIRIAKYARCSSDEQKKNGYTIGDQLSLMDDFCSDYQLVSVGEYVDEGVSATLEISKRKALAQMIEDAKAGKFDIIVIKCIDRFFRSVEEYYAAQKQLRQSGVTWISIEEPDLDPEDPDAAFKINIYLTADYDFSERLGMQAFFRHDVTDPYIANSYKTSNTFAGVTLRFSLTQ